MSLYGCQASLMHLKNNNQNTQVFPVLRFLCYMCNYCLPAFKQWHCGREKWRWCCMRPDSRAGGQCRWSWSEGTWRGSWRPPARGCSRGACAPGTGSQTSWCGRRRHVGLETKTEGIACINADWKYTMKKCLCGGGCIIICLEKNMLSFCCHCSCTL